MTRVVMNLVRSMYLLSAICCKLEAAHRVGILMAKKLKNEAELFRAALEAGMAYGEKRGAVVFEDGDSVNERAMYIYRLLVHDNVIAPMPEKQVSQKSVKHRLCLWHARSLPKDHPLLN